MTIYQNKWSDLILEVPKRLHVGRGRGMSPWPGMVMINTSIDLSSQYGKCLVVHEMIHQDQMFKYGWLKFCLLYVGQLLKGIARECDLSRAHQNMPFEIEAQVAQRKCMEEWYGG